MKAQEQKTGVEAQLSCLTQCGVRSRLLPGVLRNWISQNNFDWAVASFSR